MIDHGERRERRPIRGHYPFETVVFAVDGEIKCGCPKIRGGFEWYVLTASTAEEARINHMNACNMVASGEMSVPCQQIECGSCGGVVHLEYQPDVEIPPGSMFECSTCGEAWIRGEEDE